MLIEVSQSNSDIVDDVFLPLLLALSGLLGGLLLLLLLQSLLLGRLCRGAFSSSCYGMRLFENSEPSVVEP